MRQSQHTWGIAFDIPKGDMMDLLAGFLRWWNNDGGGTIALSISTMGEDRLHGIQLLCRVAYAQGRIDECDRMTKELQARGTM